MVLAQLQDDQIYYVLLFLNKLQIFLRAHLLVAHLPEVKVKADLQAIACDVWEAVYILDGLLKNTSKLPLRSRR